MIILAIMVKDWYEIMLDNAEKLNIFAKAFFLELEGQVPSNAGEAFKSLLGSSKAVLKWELPDNFENELTIFNTDMDAFFDDLPPADYAKWGRDLGGLFKKIIMEQNANQSTAEIELKKPVFKKRLMPPYNPELLKIRDDLKLNGSNVSTTADTTLMSALEELYTTAYQDERLYTAGLESVYLPELSTVKSAIISANCYAPAVLITLLLSPPGHRMKREDIYEKICDAVAHSLKNLSMEELQLLTKVVLSNADVEDKPVGERVNLPMVIPDRPEFEGSAHKSKANEAKKMAQTLADEFARRNQDLPLEKLHQQLAANLTKFLEQMDTDFESSLGIQDRRRLNDFAEALNADNSDTLPGRVFSNGSIGISSYIESRLNIYLMMRGTGNNNEQFTRLVSILADMKTLINKAIPHHANTQKRTNMSQSTGVAVVDQFPQGSTDVIMIGNPEKIVFDPNHGLTIEKIAEISGRGLVAVHKFSTDNLKKCFDSLKQNKDVQVVNFSSVLNKGDDSVYKAFYKLCLEKDVIVALGNNGQLLHNDGQLTVREGAEGGSAPFIENFLQGFTNWMIQENKLAADLKLVLCENYRMDKPELTEASSAIEPEHFLHSKVLRVRGDCMINPVSGVVESGTSYIAPMVAGALASVPLEKREAFRQDLTECSQILSWDALIQKSISHNTPTPSLSSGVKPHRSGFFKAAETGKEVPGIGADSTLGAAKPSIPQDNMVAMRSIMPVFGETERFEGIDHRTALKVN